MQRTLAEIELKLHDKGFALQRAVCRIAGRVEVNKVMAARAQVGPAFLCCFAGRKPHLLHIAILEVSGGCLHLLPFVLIHRCQQSRC